MFSFLTTVLNGSLPKGPPQPLGAKAQAEVDVLKAKAKAIERKADAEAKKIDAEAKKVDAEVAALEKKTEVDIELKRAAEQHKWMPYKIGAFIGAALFVDWLFRGNRTMLRWRMKRHIAAESQCRARDYLTDIFPHEERYKSDFAVFLPAILVGPTGSGKVCCSFHPVLSQGGY